MFSLLAYCPRCGEGVEVWPFVDQVVRVSPAHLDVTFKTQRVRHACSQRPER